MISFMRSNIQIDNFRKWSVYSKLWIITVTIAIVLASLAANSYVVQAQTELKITAFVDGTTKEIECPPICMDTETEEPNPPPILFQVCVQPDDCIMIKSGESATVADNAEIRAPDGKTLGQQLTAADPEVFIGFISWGDGVTINPRSISSFTGTKNIRAYYGIFTKEGGAIEPLKATHSSSATKAGCNTWGGWGLFWGAAQWVEVQSDLNRPYRELDGPVTSARTSTQDFYKAHNSQDYNFWVLLDGEEKALLSHKSGGQLGELPNQIGIEWEQDSYPTWAQPSLPAADADNQGADLVWVRGKWIYDCGHVSNEYVEGAWTEIHPPIAVATMRGTQARGGTLYLNTDHDLDTVKFSPRLNPEALGLKGVQVDMWINGDGGKVVEHVKCGAALDFFSGTGCAFTPSFDIKGIYEFDVPLPTPPNDLMGSESQFRVGFTHLLPGQPEPEVTRITTSQGDEVLRVRLDLTTYIDTWGTCRANGLKNCNGDSYGVTIVAGWEIFSLPEDLHWIKVTLESVRVFNNLEGFLSGDGEFYLDLRVGPSSVLTGDISNRTSIWALNEVNSGLLDAAGERETYPMILDGEPLSFIVRIQANNPGSDRFKLNLTGRESDGDWGYAEDVGTIDRIFFEKRTDWNGQGDSDRIPREWPSEVPPGWTDCPDATVPAPPYCYYGYEKYWGTSRHDALSQPTRYEDLALGGDENYTVSLLYTIEVIK